MSIEKTLVINLTRDTTLQVEIVDKDGNPNVVQIVPRGRVELSVGWTIDQRFMSLNKSKLRVIAPKSDPAPDAQANGGL